MVQRKNVRSIISRIRSILSKNKKLLEDEEVKRWLRVIYPLLLEHASTRDKEFFKRLCPSLFN